MAMTMTTQGLQFFCLLWAGSIFALTAVRQFFVEPLANPIPNLIWFVIQVLPILLVLPGMLRQNPRSYLLATLGAMLYFSHGVLLSVNPEHRALGLWEVGFAMALVLSASFTVRQLKRTS